MLKGVFALLIGLLSIACVDASARTYEKFCSTLCDPSNDEDLQTKSILDSMRGTLKNNDVVRIFDKWEEGGRRFYADWKYNNGAIMRTLTGYAIIAGDPGNAGGGGGGGSSGGGGGYNPPGGCYGSSCYDFDCKVGGRPCSQLPTGTPLPPKEQQ